MNVYKRYVLLLLIFFLSILLIGCNKKEEKVIYNCQAFNDGLIVAETDSGWGYVNKNGEVAIYFYYDDATPFEGGYAIVRIDDFYYLIDTEGKKVNQTGYDDLQYCEEASVYTYELNGKYGLLNNRGKVILKPTYDYITGFSNGLAPVMLDDKWGYIDDKGKVIIKLQYKDASDFKEGLAYVENSKGKVGYINKKGKVKIKFIYDGAKDFTGGVAEVKKDGIIQVINKRNKVIVKEKSGLKVERVAAGFASVQDEKENKYYLYNRLGKKILTSDEYISFSSKYIITYYGASIPTFYNLEGKQLFGSNNFPKDYIISDYYIDNYNNNIYIEMKSTNGDYKYFYWNGNKLQELNFSEIKGILGFYNDYFYVMTKNRYYGIADKSGKVILELRRGINITIITLDGYVIYRNFEGKYGLMDLHGNQILEEKYNYLVPKVVKIYN